MIHKGDRHYEPNVADVSTSDIVWGCLLHSVAGLACALRRIGHSDIVRIESWQMHPIGYLSIVCLSTGLLVLDVLSSYGIEEEGPLKLTEA